MVYTHPLLLKLAQRSAHCVRPSRSVSKGFGYYHKLGRTDWVVLTFESCQNFGVLYNTTAR